MDPDVYLCMSVNERQIDFIYASVDWVIRICSPDNLAHSHFTSADSASLPARRQPLWPSRIPKDLNRLLHQRARLYLSSIVEKE